MISKIPMILLAGLVVMGIYVLPSVVATFSGSHSMEYNDTTKKAGLACMNCHTYITDELNISTSSRSVLQAHRDAAGNTNYVGDGKNISVLNVDNSTITGACQMCHLMETGAVGIAGSHTDITIRVCTDTDCHGNNATAGTSEYPVAGSVGTNLTADTDAHSGWFDAMENVNSSYIDEDGVYYKSGFYACMACHTHAEMNMNISRPKAFNINITIGSGGVVIQGPTLNYTSPDVTTAQRPWGSVWN